MACAAVPDAGRATRTFAPGRRSTSLPPSLAIGGSELEGENTPLLRNLDNPVVRTILREWENDLPQVCDRRPLRHVEFNDRLTVRRSLSGWGTGG